MVNPRNPNQTLWSRQKLVAMTKWLPPFSLPVSLLLNVLLGSILLMRLAALSSSAGGGNPLVSSSLQRKNPSSVLGYGENVKIHWDGGHPLQPKSHNCVCNKPPDNFCMCTPSLALHIILVQGTDHVWLVRQSSKFSVLGGLIPMGDSAEVAVRRELQDQANVVLTDEVAKNSALFGVYSDPQREEDRHSIAATYAVHLDDGAVTPSTTAQTGGQLERVPLADIEKHDFVSDHKTMVLDYRERYWTKLGRPVPSIADKESGPARNLCALTA